MMDAGDAGRVIGGRYECLELIGRGGMGEVWRARDTLLQRDVAVKRLVYGEHDDVTVGRSLREARLAARLNHPNAVGIYDVVIDQGLPCLVMELVAGRSLKEMIAQQGRLDPVAAARIGRQVAAALGVAHRAGIVHRDVKPANVLIAGDGTAKLTDFGIARDEGDAGLTSSATFIGTPNFLGPEIALGGDHSPASDVWALGALLYAAVEGEPPFSTDGNPLAILNRIANAEPPVPAHGGPLTDVIVEAMRRDPAGRPSAATIVRLLDDVVDGRRARAGPPEPPVTGPQPPPFGSSPPARHYAPPAPPPPQYRPLPGFADRPPRRSRAKRLWIVAAGAAVAAAGIVAGLVAARGGHHSGLPTPGPIPTASASPASCDDPRTGGQGPALTYVVSAELFDVPAAQACTKPGSVPESFTRGLAGKVFAPRFDSTADDQAPVVTTEFTALDGTKLFVTCTEGADGKYLVTGARKE
jgi:hypothetical protein